jgi:hypothetical protein
LCRETTPEIVVSPFESARLIANREIFGDLADSERFAGACRSPLRSLRSSGAGATMETVGAATQKTV